MSRPVLFLDIDGVLTSNLWDFDDEAESSILDWSTVQALNRVLRETDCDVVLSSAWRYVVLDKSMTLGGFAYLLRTHGVAKVIQERLIGVTDRDIDVDDNTERGKQVQAWLATHPEVDRFAVVDDNDLGFSGLPFFKTDGRTGLTEAIADRLIELLGRRSV